MGLYNSQFDPSMMAQDWIYTKLIANATLMNIVKTNGNTGLPQVYPWQADQLGSQFPYIIMQPQSAMEAMVNGPDYILSDGLWLVKVLGYDTMSDTLSMAHKMLIETLHATSGDTPDGRMFECMWEREALLPIENLPGGQVVLQRGSEFRLRPQPL